MTSGDPAAPGPPDGSLASRQTLSVGVREGRGAAAAPSLYLSTRTHTHTYTHRPIEIGDRERNARANGRRALRGRLIRLHAAADSLRPPPPPPALHIRRERGRRGALH